LQQAGRSPDAHGVRTLRQTLLHHGQALLLEPGRCTGKQVEEGDVLPGETVARLERPADPSAVLAPSRKVDQEGPHEFRGGIHPQVAHLKQIETIDR